jgi:general secretion pathway protein A
MIVRVCAPITLFLGVFLVVLELGESHTRTRLYGAQFATPTWRILAEAGALVGLAVLLVGILVMIERRRAMRSARRSSRRRTRSSRLDTLEAPSRALTAMPPRAPVQSATTVATPSWTEPAAVAPAIEAPVVAAASPQGAEIVEASAELAVAEVEAATAPVVDAEPAPVQLKTISLEELDARPVAVVAPAPRSAPAGASTDPLEHWGLREPAFENAPSGRFLYLSPEHAEALFRLRYAILHRKGCAVLTGNYGCGKTTLTRALARELEPGRFDVALITNPMPTPTAFLQELLYQLGVETAARDKSSLLRALENRLLENLRAGRDTVVIVDEAQLIEDDAIFEELRLLLNFQTNDRFLLTLVMAGSDELIETLRRQPHLAQRCVVRASLQPLDREQTGAYVRHRLVTAGREAETLTAGAVDELFAATGGTPRVINAVCDLTLYVGAAAGATRVDADLVRRVAEDVTAVAA